MQKQTIHDFYEALSGDSSVGAGCAAALTALLGVGVLQKAARQLKLAESDAALGELALQLHQLIEADAAVMQKLLPQLLSLRPESGSAQWNEALLEASAVPRQIIAAALQALAVAGRMMQTAALNFRCDIRSGASLCHAALVSSALLAELNLSLLKGDVEEQKEGLKQLDVQKKQAASLLSDIMGTENSC